MTYRPAHRRDRCHILCSNIYLASAHSAVHANQVGSAQLSSCNGLVQRLAVTPRDRRGCNLIPAKAESLCKCFFVMTNISTAAGHESRISLRKIFRHGIMTYLLLYTFHLRLKVYFVNYRTGIRPPKFELSNLIFR